jgi:hypothetical protein
VFLAGRVELLEFKEGLANDILRSNRRYDLTWYDKRELFFRLLADGEDF